MVEELVITEEASVLRQQERERRKKARMLGESEIQRSSKEEPRVHSIQAWTEFVGTVKSVWKGSIELSFPSLLLHIPDDELVKWRNVLCKGAKIAILFLNNGEVRVRKTKPERA